MDSHWYKDAVLYDVDGRSFYDSDGDGIGDLRGLSDKLDYVQELGATAVVLEQSDADRTSVAADGRAVPLGVASVSHLERFLRDAHERGLRVITELQVDETSDSALSGVWGALTCPASDGFVTALNNDGTAVYE
jgi:maltose alpha-D-glucosyltransferase / alpha-amylase